MSTELIVVCSIFVAMTIAIIIISFALRNQIKKRRISEYHAAEEISSLKQQNRDNIETERLRNAAKEESLRQECENKIAICRSECNEEIRKVKEYIENHRETLKKMDEKTLLANVMIALEGYGTRIERLETSLGHEKITEKIETMISSTERKLDQLANGIAKYMEEMDITGKLENISRSISERMESFDVTGKINEISSGVDEIKEAIGDEYTYSSLHGVLSDIKSEVSSVKSDMQDVSSVMSDIKSSISDTYSYGSLAGNVESAKTAAEEARSAAEDAKRAAEDAKYAIESK